MAGIWQRWARTGGAAVSGLEARPRASTQTASAAADAEAAAHCGWFESSFELQRGLAVVELHGTVRRRSRQAPPAAGGPVAAPAWTLT